MDDLLAGYRRFRTQQWEHERLRYEALAERGQNPRTLVIGCSDSRVDPQTILGAGPGELFVVRNIAALVPPCSPDSGYHGTSAALEYAVRQLQVERIVVLGHALCGGVRALVEGAPDHCRDFVAPWLTIAEPAKNHPDPTILAGPQDTMAPYEVSVVRLSVANLLTFPWIADAVADGRLALHGFRFDIRSGTLLQIASDSVSEVSVAAR
jgi:carbonic anhydrase